MPLDSPVSRPVPDLDPGSGAGLVKPGMTVTGQPPEGDFKLVGPFGEWILQLWFFPCRARSPSGLRSIAWGL